MEKNISESRLKEIELEVYGDTQIYLENCLNNYSEYVSAAQQLFPKIYNRMKLYDENHQILEHLSDYDSATKNNDLDSQIKILKEGIQNGIYTPATYYRLAILYEKNKKIKLAYESCINWFETDYWKIPNTCRGSLKILKRLKRLEKNKYCG